jgi:hypothetical protein
MIFEVEGGEGVPLSTHGWWFVVVALLTLISDCKIIASVQADFQRIDLQCPGLAKFTFSFIVS